MDGERLEKALPQPCGYKTPQFVCVRPIGHTGPHTDGTWVWGFIGRFNEADRPHLLKEIRSTGAPEPEPACGHVDTWMFDHLKVVGYDGPEGEPYFQKGEDYPGRPDAEEMDMSGVIVYCEICRQTFCIST